MLKIARQCGCFLLSGSQFRWKNNVNQSRCRRKYRFARHRPTRVSHYVLCECLAYRNSVVFTTEFAEDFEDCTAVRVFSPQRFPIPLEKQRKSKPKNGKTPLFRCFPASFPHLSRIKIKFPSPLRHFCVSPPHLSRIIACARPPTCPVQHRCRNDGLDAYSPRSFTLREQTSADIFRYFLLI